VAVWTVPAAPAWAQAAGLLAALLLVLPLPPRWRWWAVPLVLPLLWPPLQRPAEGEFELLAADVGQGTAVLVRTREHLLVYDAGPQYAPDSDAGQRVLLPLLRWRGERRIDVLLLSHRDTDHVGGARALLLNLPVGELLSSIEAEHPLWALAPRARRCETGQRWLWDGVQFEVLHPGPEASPRWRPNATSCVLRVQAASGRSALLTGDIEAMQELAMVGRFGTALRSDVLLVPHHGSQTSSTAPFLDAVQPEVAVVQSGYRNRFGHPAPDVLARLRARVEVVHGSPACGAWSWSSALPSAGTANRLVTRPAERDPGTPQRVYTGTRPEACWRPQTRRYWHHDLRDLSDPGQ
jgi:competence protein ComEC